MGDSFLKTMIEAFRFRHRYGTCQQLFNGDVDGLLKEVAALESELAAVRAERDEADRKWSSGIFHCPQCGETMTRPDGEDDLRRYAEDFTRKDLEHCEKMLDQMRHERDTFCNQLEREATWVEMLGIADKRCSNVSIRNRIEQLLAAEKDMLAANSCLRQINAAVRELPEKDLGGGTWDVIRKLAQDRDRELGNVEVLERHIDRLQRGNTIESDFITKRESILMEELATANSRLLEALAKSEKWEQCAEAWRTNTMSIQNWLHIQLDMFGIPRDDGHECPMVFSYPARMEMLVKLFPCGKCNRPDRPCGICNVCVADRLMDLQEASMRYMGLLVGIYNDYSEHDIMHYGTKAVQEAWLEGRKIAEGPSTVCRKCRRTTFGALNCKFCKPVCQCTNEEGDSPCPVHGLNECEQCGGMKDGSNPHNPCKCKPA